MVTTEALMAGLRAEQAELDARTAVIGQEMARLAAQCDAACRNSATIFRIDPQIGMQGGFLEPPREACIAIRKRLYSLLLFFLETFDGGTDPTSAPRSGALGRP